VVFVSLFFCLLYFNLPGIDPKNNDSIQNRLGALFFVSLNLFILYFQTSLATFPVEREIFNKEYDSGLYGILPYYFAKLSIEIPLTAIFPAAFVFIVYFIVGFKSTVSSFLGFLIICILECLLGMMMGIFLGTIIPSLKMAVEISPMIFIPFLLFSGFTTNTEDIIPPLKVVEFLSPMRYTFEFLVRNEFEGEEALGDSHPVDTLNFGLS